MIGPKVDLSEMLLTSNPAASSHAQLKHNTNFVKHLGSTKQLSDQQNKWLSLTNCDYDISLLDLDLT